MDEPAAEGKVFRVPYITLRRQFKPLLRKAEIKDVRFHDLRRTFALCCAIRTKDLRSLQKLLGHSNIKMTMGYAHLIKGELQANLTLFQHVIPVEEKKDGSNLAVPKTKDPRHRQVSVIK